MRISNPIIQIKLCGSVSKGYSIAVKQEELSPKLMPNEKNVAGLKSVLIVYVKRSSNVTRNTLTKHMPK